MKKLIKLLNEWLKYEEKFWPDKLTRVAWIDDSWELLFKLENWCYWSVEYVISKRCGFIKWLVQNDKIDFYEWKYLENPIWSNNYDECDYLELIQWLAISDTPIEDLIYYLK